MVHAAHASAWHWMHAGGWLNHQRAEGLVAAAHIAAGHADAADRHARRALAQGEANGTTQSDFDIASTHACAAVAARLVGNTDRANHHAAIAADVLARLEADDRSLLEKLFPLG